MGIYLPMALTLLIPIGAVLGHLYEKWAGRTANPEFAQRMGVLLATGLIVGESLFGVVFAGIVAATNKDAPLAVVTNFGFAIPLGMLVFAAMVAALYLKTKSDAASAPPLPEDGIVPPREITPR
jgi:glycerol-3-phosphate acyltransferase PlsY